MGVGYVLVVLFGAYAALKFYHQQKRIEAEIINQRVAQPGVSYYEAIAIPQRVQQMYAFGNGYSDSTVGGVYAPSLGPQENQPEPGTELAYLA